MDKDFVTPEGKIVQRAMEAYRNHILSHQCEGCLKTYETFIEAITVWLNEGFSNAKEASQQEEGKKEGWKNPF